MKHPLVGSLVLAAAAGLGGCVQLEALEDESGNATVPRVVQDIFDAKCGGGACHTMGGAQGNLALDGNFVGQPSSAGIPVVEIGNVPGSYMAIKILPEPPAGATVNRTGTIMPPPGQPELTDEELAIIIGWIAGAQLGGDTEGTDTASDSSSDTGPAGFACGIDDVVPGTPLPIDAGTGAGQIPPDIADVLTGNCGCHYVPADESSMLEPPYLYSPRQMGTHAEFHDDPGTGPFYELVLSRVQPDAPSLMPPMACDDGGLTMPEEDRALLVSWLEAMAPDGANWP